MLSRLVLVIFTIAVTASAQQGDNPGETQRLRVPRDRIPPSPALTPSQALGTFLVPEGFRLEIAAAEPLIESPVAIEFDPDGRLWVLEMRGFMRTLDGLGEDQPFGRVSVLEDADGDGRMDRSTVFIDGLVMARAFALVRDGLLLAEPPNLWFLRDTNGDGRADEKNLVANDYATQADPKLGNRANPEHSSNSLLRTLDNWIYSANHATRFRNTAGLWQREPTLSRGQWGLSQDDFGRLFYNSNSDQLRADLVPYFYLSRNSNYPNASGANYRVASDQTVWPGRLNPGVNRGYQPGQLREDGTLRTFTGACGPVIYRGDQFPIEFRGNAFVCEPTGNLVRRNVLFETNNVISARNPYQNGEFLTSTDERFRPVNLGNGPDGALYIVDMYRGVVQHRIYVTSYLRGQAEERGLESPVDRGRIYRVVFDANVQQQMPNLAEATSQILTAHLSHSNGWWRDTAQRMLVERGDRSVVETLRQLAVSNPSALGQLHALWTLEGLSSLTPELLEACRNSEHPRVRAAAMRLCERFLSSRWRNEVVERLLQSAGDHAPEAQLQLALTLGEIDNAEARKAMQTILTQNPRNNLIRDAVLSGLAGKELDFLNQLLAGDFSKEPASWTASILTTLSQCVFTGRQPQQIGRLLELATLQTNNAAWKQLAILDGAAVSQPRGRGRRRTSASGTPIPFEIKPAALESLGASKDPDVVERLEQISALISWPGKDSSTAEPDIKPLTADQLARFEMGKELYMTTCGACHQPHGNGQEGLAPPLRDSEWVVGSEKRLILVALHGVRGPITVKGKQYDQDMPPLAILDDEQISTILTYIRREWGHTADPVEQSTVARIRGETEERLDAWTETELLKIP